MSAVFFDILLLMKPLLFLNNEDIPGNEPGPNISYKERTAVRVILFDNENKIAFVGTKAHILPGGGVHEGEGLEEAAARESMEEVGCKIEITDHLGFTEDFRGISGIHQITHCFTARVVGEKGEPTTKQDDELNMNLRWLSFDDKLIPLLKKERDKYAGRKYLHYPFNIRSHITFLEEYLKSAS